MVSIDKQLCVGCGSCLPVCTAAKISLTNGKASFRGKCIQCGHCVAICPTKAIAITDYDMDDVEEFDPTCFELNPHQLLRAIKFRRSIRQYQARPIEKEKLEMIVQAGRYTATANNRQECRFVIVQENMATLKNLVWGGIEELLYRPQAGMPTLTRLAAYRKYYENYQQDPTNDFLFRNAPVVLFIATNIPVDAGLAAQNIEHIAVSQGLGILYNDFLTRAIKANPKATSWLGLDGKPLALCMLAGYPDVKYLRTAPRRKADVIWK